MRRFPSFLFLVIIAVPACSRLHETGDSVSSEIKPEFLARHWVHSYEEEGLGSEVEVFRPNDFKTFPPSRFRMQYVLEKDGSARWYYLAPNDGHYFKPGRWSLDTRKAVLNIDQGDGTVSYRIIELTPRRLRLIRIESQVG